MNCAPSRGLVNMLACPTSAVEMCIILPSPCLIRSAIQKYLIWMCLDRIAVGLPLLSSAMQDRLSCNRTLAGHRAFVPLRNSGHGRPDSPSPKLLRALTRVLDLVTIDCFEDLTNAGPVSPTVIVHPVCHLQSACTPHAASM